MNEYLLLLFKTLNKLKNYESKHVNNKIYLLSKLKDEMTRK